MDEPLGEHGEGEARGLWPLGPSTWPLSQRASSLFEYISSFFLTPQKASSLRGSLLNTLMV